MATTRKRRTPKRRATSDGGTRAVEVASAPRARNGRMLRALRLVHPFPALLVTAVTAGLVPIADPDASAALYVQLGLGMLFYQFAIGVVNDISDRDADAAVKPWKPIPAGVVSVERARLVAAVLVAAGLLVTATLDSGAWLIGIGGLACGMVYDAGIKRTAWSFVPWAVAFPLIPTWVFVAAGEWDALLWWTFPIGALLALALHLANQSPDASDDRGLGSRGLPQLLGPRRSARVSLALFGLGVSSAAVVLVFESPARAVLVAVTGALALVLAPRAVLFFGRDGLFGLLAASAAVTALVFLSAV